MKKNIKRLISFAFFLAMTVSALYAFHPRAVKAAESSNPVYTLNVKYSCALDDRAYVASFAEVAPDFSASFDLKAGAAATPEKDSQLPLKAGIMDGIAEADTHQAVSFKSSDYTEAELNTLRSQSNKKWSDVSGHVSTSDKPQTKQVSVDFSNVKYPSPGIYHYVLSVKTSENGSVGRSYKDDDDYANLHIFVYVTQNDDGTLSTNAFDGSSTPPYKDNNNNGVQNVQKTGSISFKYGGTGFSIDKGVTGNMGDKSEYFVFNVNMKNLDKNQIYRIDTRKAPGQDNANDEYFVSDNKGEANVKIRLKNGDEAIFPYLPKNTVYEISEGKKGGYDTLIGKGKESPSATKAISEYLFSPDKYNLVSGYNGAYSSDWDNIKKIELSRKDVPLEIYGTDDSGKSYTKTVTETYRKYIVGSYNENNEVVGTLSLYTTAAIPITDPIHYINVRNGILPTGVILNNLPAIFGILSIAIMAVIIVLTRKKPAKKEKQSISHD